MIQVKELKYTYPRKKQQTLRGLDFEIGAGEVFGFLGPSGAGKSTIQNILVGKLQNYEGAVHVFGQEMKKAGVDYYERIGVSFEFPNFYGRFTALENLNHFRSLYRNRDAEPMALLESVGMSQAAHTKVEQFSKGMKMRLNYCRAVLNDPEILFLDEPTSGLDPVNTAMLKRLILQRKEAGTTVLITTHNMQAAEELCDRVAFIVDGEIKRIDTPHNLKLRGGERKVRVEYEGDQGRSSEDFALDGIGDDARFLELLRYRQIITMHTLEASMDQIFIDVTGRSLV
ncbi:ABC transporter ATP-binding protein [Cohnella sp. CIP 111063]|uniref:ABC transporter ATP-binding protein n=1 Tax=unclassified Cohnella TaxID=2636738 RepID=UPI000B8C4FD3|nr:MULTISPECIES: ABC transporter ATP-binding protein [unclassified Cohnella]OXS56969.1 ABC transporter ATP-binding protein [Cohnella sp. CIP 111063]PRX69821.1 fluoroquinolone transport system ATP-binding protein [Cohnella sp. SGD-V74]